MAVGAGPGGKAQKARELGLTVMTGEEWMELAGNRETEGEEKGK